MAQKCTICCHPKHKEIDEAVVLGKLSIRKIAGQYGVKQSSLQRHKDNGHISKKIQAAQAVQNIREGMTLLQKLQELEGIAKETIAQAAAADDLRGKCQAIREYRATLELTGKATGEIKDRHEVTGKDGKPIETSNTTTLNVEDEVKRIVRLMPQVQQLS